MLVGTFKVIFQVDFISVQLNGTHKCDLMIELIDPIFEEPIFCSQLYSITNNTVNINESSQFQMYILYDYPTNKFLRKQCQLVLNMQASSSKAINTRLAGKLKPNFADILNNQDSIYLTVRKHKLANSSVRGQIEMKISVISKEEIKKEEQEIMADKLVDQFVTLSPTKKGKVKIRSQSQQNNEKKQLTPQKPKKLQPLNSPSKKQIGIVNLPPRPNRASQKFIRKVPQQKPSPNQRQMQNKSIQQNMQQKKNLELNALLQQQKKKSQLIKQQLENLKQNLIPLQYASKQIEKLTKEKQEWQQKQKRLLLQIESVNPQEIENKFKEYCEVKEQNLTIKYQLADCFNELETIKGNLDKAKDQIDSYIEENINLKKIAQNLQKQLQNSTIEKQKDEQKGEIESLKNSITILKNQIAEKDQTIANMARRQNYWNEAQTQIFKLESDLSQKIKEVHESKATIKKYKRQLQNLQKSINYEANKNLSEQNTRLKANQLEQIEYSNVAIQKMSQQHKKTINSFKMEMKNKEKQLQDQIHKRQIKIQLLQDSQQKLLEKQYQVKMVIQKFQIEYARMLKMIQEKDSSQQSNCQKIKRYQQVISELQLKIMEGQSKQNQINQLEDNAIKLRSRIKQLQAIVVDKSSHGPLFKINFQSIPQNSQQSIIEQVLMSEYNHMKKSYEKILEQMDKKQKAYQKTQLQITNLSNQIKIREKQIEKLKNAIDEKDGQIKRIIENKKQLEAVLMKKASKEQKNLSLLQMKQVIKVQNNKINELETEILQAKSKIIQLQNKIVRQTQQVNLVQADSYALHENMNMTQEERQRLQEENKKLRAENTVLKNQNKQIITQASIPNDNLQFSFRPKKNKEQTLTNLRRENETLKLEQQQDKKQIKNLQQQVYNTKNRNFNSPIKSIDRNIGTSTSQKVKQLEPFIKELIHHLSDRSKRLRIEQVIQTLNGYKILLEGQQQQYKDKILIQQRARALSMQFQQLKLFIVQNKQISKVRNQLLSLLKRSQSEINQLVKISQTLAEEAMNHHQQEEMQ